jgi:catechol 2,3-dioxygenase-like lactoylglutathione lyase family enzyme
MNIRTVNVTLASERDAVFSYLSRIERLSEWAPGFCRSLRREGEHWRGVTPGGEDYVALLEDPRTGVLDLFIGARLDEMALVPLRVVRQPTGTLVTCTFFLPSGWSQEVFDCYADGLIAGLRGLAARFGGGELSGADTSGGRFFPSVVTSKFYETWDFYTLHLGFRTHCEHDAYVHLVHPEGAQFGVLREEIDGLPSELVSATNGRGIWLNLEVPDADAAHARLRAAGVEIVEEPEDKPWGNRQFLVRDPNGVLVAIAHRLPAGREALASLPAAS